MTSRESLAAQSNDLKPVREDVEEKPSDMGEPLTAFLSLLGFFVLKAPAVVSAQSFHPFFDH